MEQEIGRGPRTGIAKQCLELPLDRIELVALNERVFDTKVLGRARKVDRERELPVNAVQGAENSDFSHAFS